MLFRNPRAFAYLLIAIGLCLLGYYGEKLWRLPTWTAAEIEQSVELNLALDLRHRGRHLQPTPEKLAELRTTVRAEVEADIRRERETLERWLGLGAILCMLGVGHFVKQLLAARTRPN
jgi:hypothetical protein